MKKLYTVATVDEIIGLNIQGPLTTPTKMEFNNVLQMIQRGYTVYEHNPKDLTEKVLVNTSNINSITFKNSRADALSRRELNKTLIEESKPTYVEPIASKKQKSKKVGVTDSTENTKKEEQTNTPDKVSKPDDFSSNLN